MPTRLADAAGFQVNFHDVDRRGGTAGLMVLDAECNWVDGHSKEAVVGVVVIFQCQRVIDNVRHANGLILDLANTVEAMTSIVPVSPALQNTICFAA
jgi:hypothetical protein